MSQSFYSLPLDQLNKHQIGQFGNYWVRMYLTGLGIKIIEKSVRVNNFFATLNSDPIEIYVRTARPKNNISYSFILKEAWGNILRDNVYVSLVLVEKNSLPAIYLISAKSWEQPNGLLVDRDYSKVGQISKPEWGISTNQKNMELLQEYELMKQLNNMQN